MALTVRDLETLIKVVDQYAHPDAGWSDAVDPEHIDAARAELVKQYLERTL